MGAVYDVYVTLNYQPEVEDAVIERLNEYIDERDGNGVNFGLDRLADPIEQRSSIFGLMQIFLTERGLEVNPDGSFESHFDASYGWESVMTDMFEYVADLLEDGSRMEVYPDSGSDILEVSEGEAVWLS